MKPAKQAESYKGVITQCDGNNQHDKTSLTQAKHNDWNVWLRETRQRLSSITGNLA